MLLCWNYYKWHTVEWMKWKLLLVLSVSISPACPHMSLSRPSALIEDWWSGVSRCLTLCNNPWLKKPAGKHTHSSLRLPPLLDEVIIVRRVCASIAHSAQELSIHTYCSLGASVRIHSGTETQQLNQSPIHIKIGDLTECAAQWAK